MFGLIGGLTLMYTGIFRQGNLSHAALAVKLSGRDQAKDDEKVKLT